MRSVLNILLHIVDISCHVQKMALILLNLFARWRFFDAVCKGSLVYVLG